MSFTYRITIPRQLEFLLFLEGLYLKKKVALEEQERTVVFPYIRNIKDQTLKIFCKHDNKTYFSIARHFQLGKDKISFQSPGMYRIPCS